MKAFIFLTAIIVTAVGCSKDNTVSIAGNWNLINDSVHSSVGIEVFANNYKGLNSDYFYFNNDGRLYIKEDTLYDTLHYQILSNNRIIIDSISLSENGTFVPSNITTLTSHKASIEVTMDLPNPGGTYARFINLTR